MTTAPHRPHTTDDQEAAGLDRRRFVGYVIGGSTLAVAADMTLGATGAGAATVQSAVGAAVTPSPAQVSEAYDLEDLETDAARPTANLITVTVGKDGIARFAVPRMEVGQGITTALAMVIAEEMDLPLSKVVVTLAPARAELVFNQLTGGSNTMVSMYTPTRVAAALARGRLLEAAAAELGSAVALLTSKSGVITGPTGSITYGEVAEKAASSTTKKIEAVLKPASEHTVVGTPRNRVDARDIVTGKKQFAMDLKIPGALPAMICRPPQHQGKPLGVNNLAAVRRMPGVTDVVQVPTGVAVRAATFGQCIDAVRALSVTWAAGTAAKRSDASVLADLRAAELPLAVPKVPALAKTVEGSFQFMFRSGAALEPGCAVADYKAGKVTVWGGFKSPIDTQGKIADALGIAQTSVTVNVITGGGSFGHKLFSDAGIEAAQVSKAMGKAVRLMWHRCDEPRQGRSHAMSTSRIRATVLAGSVLSFEQRHTAVSTDFRHGLGERFSAMAASLPTGLGNLSVSEGIFALTQELGYNFGAVTQLLNETDSQAQFATGSVRNIYSPDVRTAAELMVDKLAEELGQDPVELRLAFLKEARAKAVLRKAAEVGNWGKKMAAGTAQGVAIHREYKGTSAVVVEIDCRPATVNRKIRDGIGGPRVTRATIVIDAGLVINPRGLDAQMMGGVSDGIAQALTSSSHLRDGAFLEGSWDNFFYTRQWNVPPRFQCVVMPSTGEQPGGGGEAGVAATMAATACAYGRATGTMPTRFPILHDETPKHFEVKPFVPPVPESPTDGLRHTY